MMNLYAYMREKGANEELFPIILVSITAICELVYFFFFVS